MTTKHEVLQSVYRSCANEPEVRRVLDDVLKSPPDPELSDDDLASILAKLPPKRPWLDRWILRWGATQDELERVQTHAGKFASDMVTHSDKDAVAIGELFALLSWVWTERPRNRYAEVYDRDIMSGNHGGLLGAVECWQWDNRHMKLPLWEILASLYTMESLDFDKIDLDMLDRLQRARRGK